jgi:hypothetical protein
VNLIFSFQGSGLEVGGWRGISRTCAHRRAARFASMFSQFFCEHQKFGAYYSGTNFLWRWSSTFFIKLKKLHSPFTFHWQLFKQLSFASVICPSVVYANANT